jgi:DNA-binding transcriptional LysR family regulator
MNLLSEKGLSLERLSGFLEVAEVGSISKAALGDLSRQSLLSRQIKELETFFAVKLTQKKGRGVELTAEGQELARRTREAFRLWEQFHEQTAGRRKRIAIGGAGSVLEWLLVPTLAGIGQRSFDLRFVGGRTQELSYQVEDGRIDFAVIRADAATKRMRALSLGEHGYHLWLPVKWVPKGKAKAELLADIPLAVTAGGSFRTGLAEALRKAAVEPNIAVETTSFSQALEAAKTGNCGCFLPDYAKPTTKEIKKVPLPGLSALKRKLVLVHLNARYDLEKIADKMQSRLGLG